MTVLSTGTIYERVGGYAGFKQIATDILALHHANPVLERRYGSSPKNDEQLIVLVTELLCSVTGGNETYTGMNMHDAHTGMNINHEEFLEVLTDISKALQKNGVSQADHDAIMNLNFGLMGEVLVATTVHDSV
jgi:hemoglobin